MSKPTASQLRDALVALSPRTPEAIEGLRPLYDAAVVFRDPIQEVRGLDAFLALNRRLLGRMRSLEWTVTSALENESEIVLEWTMRGAPKLGPSLEVSGVTRARCRGGLIVDHRDYWDMGELLASSVPGGQKLLHLALSPFA